MSWILANGQVCLPDSTSQGELDDAVEFGCRRTGGYCTDLDGSRGFIMDCGNNASRVASMRVSDTGEMVDESQVIRLSEIVITAGASRSVQQAAAVVDSVKDGIFDAYSSITGYTSGKQQVTQGQSSTTQQQTAPIVEPQVVEQASILPGGPWPWVIGGLVIVAIGSTAVYEWWNGRR